MSEWLMPGNKNRTEQAIIGPDGQQLIPDRVVYFKDRIDVLDFKTGNPHENHHKQVMKYVNAIQSMESLPVRGYLIYTNKRVLERVV